MSSSQSSHDRHKAATQMVKIQGVMIDEPSRRVVSVYDEDDWREIHRNPGIRVGCRMAGCETLLTPKLMARTGTRFFAMRRGSCTHFEVKRPATEAAAARGGGEETKEHEWVKGRLARIAQKVGLDAIIEDSKTHADVYLPGPRIALEYQRVRADFTLRTRQRENVGVVRTLWLIRQQPGTKGTKSALRRMFDEEVYHRGALYLDVVDAKDYRQQLRPWDDPATLNRRARLTVGGSVVQLSPDGAVFTRRSESFARFLADVASGARVLRTVPIRPAKGGPPSVQLAWVLHIDVQRCERERAARAARASATRAETVGAEHVVAAPATAHLVGSEGAHGDVIERATEPTANGKALAPEASAIVSPPPPPPPSHARTPVTPLASRPLAIERPISTWKLWLLRHFKSLKR